LQLVVKESCSEQSVTPQVSFGTTRVSIPGGTITFSPDAGTAATTSYANGMWSTTVSACQRSPVFFSGLLYTLQSPINQGDAGTNELVRRMC